MKAACVDLRRASDDENKERWESGEFFYIMINYYYINTNLGLRV